MDGREKNDLKFSDASHSDNKIIYMVHARFFDPNNDFAKDKEMKCALSARWKDNKIIMYTIIVYYKIIKYA